MLKVRCCIVISLVILLSAPFVSHAQSKKYTITGKLLDSAQQKPVAYATVNILDTTDNPVIAAFSDENGFFKIEVEKKGRYNAEISFVGFKTKLIPVLIEPGQDVSVGTILLTASSGVLDEVKVTARKKLIEQRPGMLVYNAENDLTNKGGTAADVLRKAPVLNVDAQGNVSMRGSSNLKILVNGKYSGQMARSPADALNMMPADIIKSVEVITTPSAKYDAEGAAGVINIITKKGNADLSGALEVSVSNLEQMFNPRIAFSKGKWSMSLHAHVHRLRQKEASELNRKTLDAAEASTLSQLMESDNAAPHGSGDLQITYSADSLSEWSLAVNTWVGRWPENNTRNTRVLGASGAVQEAFSQDINGKSRYLGSDISLGYNRKFSRPGQELSVLTQFTPASDKTDYDARQLNDHDLLLYRELNDSKTVNREWTVQVDYLQPLSKTGKYSLESGVKGVFRNVSNNYDVFASNTVPADELVLQPGRTDIFKYKQDVLAAYSMMKINMKNNWYAEAGARVEYTVMEGRFRSNGNTFSSKFTNFVPTAMISKKMSDGQSVTLSYTKRLTRPYIWDLNPNVNASDPKNIRTGNPELEPEIAHQAELSYGITSGTAYFINTALFWKKTNGAIIEYTQIDANGISTTSNQNLAGNVQGGVNISSSVTISPVWSMNGNINVNYLDYSSDALQIFNKGWASDFSLNSIFKLPRNYGIQMFGEYNTRSVTLQGYDSYRYYYSFAFKKSLPKSKINITLAAVNPFNKAIRQTVVMNTPEFTSNAIMRYYNRALKLTLNWEFGRSFNQKETKRITNDDVNVQGKG